MEPSRTLTDSHHLKMVDLRIMNFYHFGHVVHCVKNRTNLLFVLGLPRLLSYFMMLSSSFELLLNLLW